jgi:GT2 family glycosyltransferase
MTAPVVSVVTPVYQPVLSELRKCLSSARHENAEHILVIDGRDNATNEKKVRQLAKKYGATVIVRPTNGGISRATNDGFEASRGEFVLFLDQDDYLEPQWFGLFAIAAETADFVYSDAYVVSRRGRILARFLKPDWSPTRLANNMYACHFFAVRRELFARVGGMRPEFDGAQDHDIALRISREDARFVHIPHALYNWRQSAASTAANPENKIWAFEAGVAAAQVHIDRLGLSARVEPLAGSPGCYVSVFAPRRDPISVAVPTAFGAAEGASQTFIEMLLLSLRGHLGTVPGDEVVVISAGEDTTGILDRIQQKVEFPITHIIDDSPFNFSARCNIAIDACSNELNLLLNDDIEFTAATSLDQLVGNLKQKGVGLVSALLTYADGTVQHAGHRYTTVPQHAYYRVRNRRAALGELVIDREVEGVTGALFLQQKSVWREVGGFNENFPLNYNDVDYCLKVRALGYRIIQVNSTEALHHESQTRDSAVSQDEIDRLFARWPYSFTSDSFTRN